MRTPRVFIPDVVVPGDRVRLPEPEARHLARVLRRGPGDAVRLLTQGGRAFDARIHEVAAGGGVVVEVGDELPGDTGSPRVAITLGLAVVKGQAFDLAHRMATELGIDTVVPLFTSRTVVRWDGSSDKRPRHERIVQEAAKQCGRTEPLRLEAGAAFASWIESRRETSGSLVPMWIAVPGAALPEPPRAPAGGRVDAVFAVGPEGGFTEAEVRSAVAAGWRTCGFPTPILRTPTAVAVIAAIGLLWGET